MNEQQMQRVTSDDLATWYHNEERATEAVVDAAIRTLRGLVQAEGAGAFRTLPNGSPYHDPQILVAIRKLVEDIDGSALPGGAQPDLMARFGGPWSMDEETTLVQAFRAGADLQALMRRHQRSENAILFRLHRLGCIESPDVPAFGFVAEEAAFLRAERSYLDPENAFEPVDRIRESRFGRDEDDAAQPGFDDVAGVVEEPEDPEPCADWSCCFDDMDADQWEELMSAPEIEDLDIHYFNQGAVR